MTAFTLNLRPIAHLNDAQFEQLCVANPGFVLNLAWLWQSSGTSSR
jgi:hypothetical protein